MSLRAGLWHPHPCDSHSPLGVDRIAPSCKSWIVGFRPRSGGSGTQVLFAAEPLEQNRRRGFCRVSSMAAGTGPVLAGPSVTGSLSLRNRASQLELRCLKAPAGPASCPSLLICLCTRQGSEGPLASFGPVTVSRLPPHCWPLSNPFLIFCFPVNFKIELNCKLDIALLLFRAPKEEAWPHLGRGQPFLFTFRRWFRRRSL